MNYQPKIVYNPTGKRVEFMLDRQSYTFEPGEKKILEGFTAYHALVQTNTGLVEYDGQDSKPAEMPLEEMPWRNLVSLGASLGVHKVGMDRETLIKSIKEIDGQETGASTESDSEEEA